MKDIIVEMVLEKDSIKFYFGDYAEAADFIQTAMYAAHNMDSSQVVKFFIYADMETP